MKEKIQLIIYNFRSYSLWRLKFPQSYFNEQEPISIIIIKNKIRKKITKHIVNNNLKNLFTEVMPIIIDNGEEKNPKINNIVFKSKINPIIFRIGEYFPSTFSNEIDEKIKMIMNKIIETRREEILKNQFER